MKHLIFIILIGCGTEKSNESAPQTLPPWSEPHHNEAMASCIEGASVELELELSKRYCTCIVAYIETQWSHETYYSDEKYGESLVENGQVDSCYQKSL